MVVTVGQLVVPVESTVNCLGTGDVAPSNYKLLLEGLDATAPTFYCGG
jgi:hypothetical protein